MKKLISIGVALSLLVTFMVPVAVAADYEEPTNYSKTPFSILGSFFTLLGEGILTEDLMAELGMDDMDWISDVLAAVGEWIAEPLAWMTDMTGWAMVAVGDVAASAAGLLEAFGVEEEDLPINDVAQIFYVMGARIFDAWGIFVVDEDDVNLPGAGIGLED